MAVASTAKLINYPSYNPIKNPFKTSSPKGKEHGIAESREIFNWLLELVRDINWIPLLLSCINRPSLVFRFVDNLTFKKKRGRKENAQKSVFLSTAFVRFVINRPSLVFWFVDNLTFKKRKRAQVSLLINRVLSIRWCEEIYNKEEGLYDYAIRQRTEYRPLQLLSPSELSEISSSNWRWFSRKLYAEVIRSHCWKLIDIGYVERASILEHLVIKHSRIGAASSIYRKWGRGGREMRGKEGKDSRINESVSFKVWSVAIYAPLSIKDSVVRKKEKEKKLGYAIIYRIFLSFSFPFLSFPLLDNRVQNRTEQRETAWLET